MSAVLYEKELQKGTFRGRRCLQKPRKRFYDTCKGATRPDIGKYSILTTEIVILWPILINRVPFCNKH
jgi:hypothetical protein